MTATVPARARRTRVVLPHGALKCDPADAHRIAAEHGGHVEHADIALLADGSEILGPWESTTDPADDAGTETVEWCVWETRPDGPIIHTPFGLDGETWAIKQAALIRLAGGQAEPRHRTVRTIAGPWTTAEQVGV